MKLLRAQAQNYRSIVDSGIVDLEDRVTVIIGKNEQGKTTFLRALTSFRPSSSFVPNDLPNHLRVGLETKQTSDIPIITLWLSLDPKAKAALKNVFPDVDAIEEVRITRFFDGGYIHWGVKPDKTETRIDFGSPKIAPQLDELRKLAESLKAKLAAHDARLPTFAQHRPQADAHIDAFVKSKLGDPSQIDNLIKTFITALTGVPGQDQTIQEEIATQTLAIQAKQVEIQKLLNQDYLKSFQNLFPKFVFHSTSLDKIPNEVNLNEFIKDAETNSRGMLNLCRAAGLSIQKIQELAATTDTSTRESHEDHYRANISGGINEYWTQESYQVHFRFAPDKLSVSISDDTYSRRIAPSDRSDGFQWYLSFYSALLNVVSSGEPTVLLLDNPGLELHADGQRDIKHFLEEKLPTVMQLIYVTHSSAMVDPYRLEQVRQVELRGDMQGTKIFKLLIKDGKDFDLLEPVRSAIGASLVTTLLVNDFNVLVEGAADKPILEAAFLLFYKEHAKKILVNGSISETKDALLPLFYTRAKLPFVIYLDSDSRGRELAKSLPVFGIPADKIFLLRSIVGDEIMPGTDLELEDILSPEFYHKAVNRTYLDKTVDMPPAEKNAKRTKQYEKLYKEKYDIGFNKRRVAETAKELLLTAQSDEVSLGRLKTVADKLYGAYKEQTGA